MPRQLLVLAVLCIATLACNAPSSQVPTATLAASTTQPLATVTQPTAAATTTSATSAPAATQPVTLPTPASSNPDLQFSPTIFFAPAPDIDQATRAFPADTPEIYALWSYSNMSAGDTVRREWYLNGDVWIEREAAWDFAKYGTSGTVQDISIYADDRESLPEGHYELRLYVNDVPQFIEGDAANRSFDITNGADSAPLPSDDGSLIAYVDGNTKLVVKNATTNQVVGEYFDDDTPNTTIAGFDWLPQGNYLVYSIKYPDPTGAPFPNFALWIVHVDSGTLYPIGEPEEGLHHPSVSPDGRYIAVIQGTGYGDACGVDWTVAVIELDTAKVQRNALYQLQDFTGLPEPTIESFAYSIDVQGMPVTGLWSSNSQLRTALSWTCVEPSASPAGIYTLDLSGKTIQKFSDLP